MTKRTYSAALFVLATLTMGACSAGTSVAPLAGLAVPVAPAKHAGSQYLDVYNAGSPGIYTGEFARYSLPDLTLLETTKADGVASPPAFGKDGLPYFVDEAIPVGFGVYLQPVASGAVAAQQQFYGIPCVSSSLATGPTGNFYVVQYCSGSVLEFAAGAKPKKAKKPIATYSGGGNLKQVDINPTYAAVDPSGNLYVGDNEGGVTYFAAGTRKGTVAFATGHAGFVTQMVVDAAGDVWSIHQPNPTQTYFANKISCVPDPKGSIVRNEAAERFSKGTLVQQLYTAPSDSSVYTGDGLSIAVSSSGRVYTGDQDSSDDGVLIDYDPGQSCPNEKLSFILPTRASPQVAVDGQGRYYVTDYYDNTIASYQGGSKKLIKRITQETGLIDITYTAINP